MHENAFYGEGTFVLGTILVVPAVCIVIRIKCVFDLGEVLFCVSTALLFFTAIFGYMAKIVCLTA